MGRVWGIAVRAVRAARVEFGENEVKGSVREHKDWWVWVCENTWCESTWERTHLVVVRHHGSVDRDDMSVSVRTLV